MLTREALREAAGPVPAQAFERALNEGRVAALRETLGFLAHELNTPLATVRGYVSTVAARHLPPAPGAPPGVVQFTEDQPGEIVGGARTRGAAGALLPVAGVHLRAVGARRLSRRRAQTVSAGEPGRARCSTNFPSRTTSAHGWAATCQQDFLPARPARPAVPRAVHLDQECACWRLRGRPRPSLRIEVGARSQGRRAAGRGSVSRDNGPGIAPEVLAKLTREPVTTRAGNPAATAWA